MKNRVEVMHGVNLDALGRRTPEHYGTTTLSELELRIKKEQETPTALSELSRDVDPIVERVILRCLEKDPRRR